ncbi:carbohydrate kinase family protein [Aquimarina sp. 2201CG14-23]|uniref:carbohydrate kinase family protein n=1 Tax=Aquimarina mycalae TaxID=3040073 RepID=UPI00247804D6|nr:carbohydrate kinase [Aquimarina sp. 2201CG14-23]MDH7448091.1 carbohydrate kinase [Aquimarina sp. 2201CG14-23]
MKITCFGEVLWDIFPTHKKIGGAPLNVALRLNTMGIKSSIITKVGADNLGDDIITYIKTQGLTIDTILRDDQYQTGEVLVALDQEGTASYTISYPVAWDFIEVTKQMINEVSTSDAIIFGSLASRNKVSRKALFQLLDVAQFKILDVNLRPPHYDIELLLELMKSADFIKLNDEELNEICTHFEINKTTIEDQIKAIASHTNTDQICVTKGGKGAVLLYRNSLYHNNGYKVDVVDTVGAGDSFLATLISRLLKGTQPQLAIDYACAIGAMVAGSEGANPIFSDTEIKSFIEKQ